jgi:hypothetical protein
MNESSGASGKSPKPIHRTAMSAMGVSGKNSSA